MSVYFKIKRAIAGILIQRKKTLAFSEPIVSFTFDDVHNTALTNGAAILKKYGYRGTYYISLGLSSERNPGIDSFDQNMLEEIVSDGGELACHTFNHIQFCKTAKKDIIRDLARNLEAMDKIIPGYRFTSFAYPYGQQTIASKLITGNNFKSARSITRGVNVGVVDMNNLKAVELKKPLKLSTIFSFIDKAIKLNAWLIFYTHNVGDKTASSECDRNYFESVVKYCSDKKVTVLTIEKVLEKVEKM